MHSIPARRGDVPRMYYVISVIYPHFCDLVTLWHRVTLSRHFQRVNMDLSPSLEVQENEPSSGASFFK